MFACATEEEASPGSAADADDQVTAAPASVPADAEPSANGEASGTAICNHLLAANDIPFATAVFPSTDACPNQRSGFTPQPSTTVAEVRRDAPGSYCLSGEVSTGQVKLVVSFDHINDLPMPAVHGPLDAVALGVSAIQFTLESPPASGLNVALSNVIRDACGAMDLCINTGLFITSDGVPIRFTDAGTQTLRLADLEPGAEAVGAALDMSRFAGIEFRLNPGPFDFCVHDVRLLDASGAALAPAGG